MVSIGQTFVVKEDREYVAKHILTYSDGSNVTEIDYKYSGFYLKNGDGALLKNGKQDTSYTGVFTKGNDGYWLTNGSVDTCFSGKKSWKRGTLTLEKGKIVGAIYPVPKVNQNPTYPTGCEAASAASLLQYYGYNVSVSQMVNYIPRENIRTVNGKRYGPDIREKFAGDPRHGYTSASPGYGAFAPVVTKSMNRAISDRKGAHEAVNISGTPVVGLYKNLMEGYPMVVWATYNMKNPNSRNSWYCKGSDGKYHYYSYPRGTHVMVFRGFDKNNVYVMDPYGATYKTFSRSAFASHYKYDDQINQMAIIVREKTV